MLNYFFQLASIVQECTKLFSDRQLCFGVRSLEMYNTGRFVNAPIVFLDEILYVVGFTEVH